MKKLLIMGKAQANREIIDYTRSIGVHSILTDNYSLAINPVKAYADEYWMISTEDIDALETRCREEKIDAIVCGISEFNIEQSMKLCQRLNLPFYCTPEAWSYSKDKMKFRELCEKMGAPMATYYPVKKDMRREDLDKVRYPCVVKPVDRNGNRGISFCFDETQLKKAFEYAFSVSKSDKIVVERMLKGQEYYAFYAMAEGEPALIALHTMCHQPNYPYNCYSFLTSDTKELEHFLRELNEKLMQVLKAVGCREGVAWFEFILDEDNHFYILEMGYRMNGELTFLCYEDVCGFDVIKWLTDISLGVKHKKSDLPKSQTKAYEKSANVFACWTKEAGKVVRIDGLDELAHLPNVHVTFVAQEGDFVDKYRHIGSVIFSAQNFNDKVKMLEKIKNTLRVVNEKGNNIAIFYTDYERLKEV